MSQAPDPIGEANEADVAEQRMPVDGAPGNQPIVSPGEANEADALEQGAIVADDDEDAGDEAYPRDDDG